MKTNKIIAVSAAALVLTSVCTSCGKKDDKDPSSKSSVKDSSSEVTSATEEETTGSDSADINDYIDEETPQPALWKVTDPDSGSELYMMGTIHIISENTFPLPDYIMDVYNNCDGVAVEYDISSLQSDFTQYQDYLMQMVYMDGTTIKDHISAETYEKASDALSQFTSMASAFDAYMPGMWLSLIESYSLMSIDNMSADGVDSQFISLAQQDGKEVVSIETLETQTNALTGLSDELADYMLAEAVDDAADPESLAQAFADQYNAWASGDVDALAEESEEDELPDELLDDYADYMDIMLYDRNEGMAQKASEYLKNGDNYFFMVGSMHFAGDRGVDDLLEDMGYTVEKIK